MDQKISALKVQKKNPNRISVYLDDEFAFGVSRIVGAWLRIGEVLTSQKIEQLKRQDSQEAALQKAMTLLGFRPRSEQEIRLRLNKAGFDPEIIELTLKKLSKSGLLGDTQFAQQWVENRTEFKPRSRRMLAYELHQKGVPDALVQEALNQTEDDDSLAYHAASRHRRKFEKLEKIEYQKKMLGYLGRLGFNYEVARSASDKVWQEMEEFRSEHEEKIHDDYEDDEK